MSDGITTRWVGIDEAGYGPNLGPLVMTAVVAEGPGDRRPDVWRDLASTVARAGGAVDRVWVDDSKAIYRGGAGRDRLEAACLAAVACARGKPPASFGGLLEALEAGTFTEVEVAHWLETDDHDWPAATSRDLADRCQAHRAFAGAAWRIIDIRSVVVGPARFNAGLAGGRSKAQVHFAAFAHLLTTQWQRAGDGIPTCVRSDKHGGRHFYFDLLINLFADTWIDRGPEGPDLSRYTVRDRERTMELSLMPRADGDDGLVALASIVSKTVRECWMDVFNAYWSARLPGLRPTAGYPLDAARFRTAIEAACLAQGFEPHLWWRER
jgi:hypothetical protein